MSRIATKEFRIQKNEKKMKRTHENVEKVSRRKSVGENDLVPLEQLQADSEEFPTDLQILIKLLHYCKEQKLYPHEIDEGDGWLDFGLHFDGKVRPAQVSNRIMELELEYLKMAGRSESSFVLPEDKMKFCVSKSIWQRKYGDIDQIADIEFLRNIFECYGFEQAYPSGNNVAKRIKKLQKKYLRSLKIENGTTSYLMSPEDEEIFRLSSFIWDENAVGFGQVSGREPKRTLDDVQDIEILNCMIAYYAKNKAYPFNYSQMISICRDFLHIDDSYLFLLAERVARLLWKYMISLHDQQLFSLSRFLWGDTLWVVSDHDSTEEISSGDEEDDTDENKNDKNDGYPKS